MVKLGAPMMVRPMVVLDVSAPEVPVTTRVALYGGREVEDVAPAVALAVRVRIWVPALPGAKLAVTPVGSPVTARTGVPV